MDLLAKKHHMFDISSLIFHNRSQKSNQRSNALIIFLPHLLSISMTFWNQLLTEQLRQANLMPTVLILRLCLQLHHIISSSSQLFFSSYLTVNMNLLRDQAFLFISLGDYSMCNSYLSLQEKHHYITQGYSPFCTRFNVIIINQVVCI